MNKDFPLLMDSLFQFIQKQQQCEKNIISNGQAVFQLFNSEKPQEQLNQQKGKFILAYYYQKQVQVREFNRITDEMINDVYKYRHYNYLMQNQFDKIMQSITISKTKMKSNLKMNSIQSEISEISDMFKYLENDWFQKNNNVQLQETSWQKLSEEIQNSEQSLSNEEQNNLLNLQTSLFNINIDSLNQKPQKIDPIKNNCSQHILSENSSNIDYCQIQKDQLIFNEKSKYKDIVKLEMIENEDKQLNSQLKFNEIIEKDCRNQLNMKQSISQLKQNYNNEITKDDKCRKNLEFYDNVNDKKARVLLEYEENIIESCGKVKNQISKNAKNSKFINDKQNKLKQKKNLDIEQDQNYFSDKINLFGNLGFDQRLNNIENNITSCSNKQHLNNTQIQTNLNNNEQKCNQPKPCQFQESNLLKQKQIEIKNLEKIQSNIKENLGKDGIGDQIQSQNFDNQNQINQMEIEDCQISLEFKMNIELNENKEQQLQKQQQESYSQSLIFNDVSSQVQKNNNDDPLQDKLNKCLEKQNKNRINNTIQEDKQLYEEQQLHSVEEQKEQEFNYILNQSNQDILICQKLKQEPINEDSQKQQLNEVEQNNLDLLQSTQKQKEQLKNIQDLQIYQQQEINKDKNKNKEKQDSHNNQFDKSQQSQQNVNEEKDNLSDIQIDYKQQNIHQFEQICQENQSIDSDEDQKNDQQSLNLSLNEDFQCEENNQYFNQQKYFNEIKSNDNFDFNEDYQNSFKINSNFSQDCYILQIKQEPIQYDLQDHSQIQNISHHQQNFNQTENQSIIIQEFDLNSQHIAIQSKQQQPKKQFSNEISLIEIKEKDGIKKKVKLQEERLNLQQDCFSHQSNRHDIQQQHILIEAIDNNDSSNYKDIVQNQQEQIIQINNQSSYTQPNSQKNSSNNKKNEQQSKDKAVSSQNTEKQKKKLNPGRPFKELTQKEIEILRVCDRKETSSLAKSFGMNYQTMRKAIIKLQSKK